MWDLETLRKIYGPVTRAQIVACARTFLGTPFRHQGRRKGTSKECGMDCVGIPLCVGETLGLEDVTGVAILSTDHLNYGPGEVQGGILGVCRQRLIEKPLAAALEPGDVLVLCVPDVPTHAAIVTELQGGLGMIHAYAGTILKVCENRIDEKWRRRIVAVFTFPGVVR